MAINQWGPGKRCILVNIYPRIMGTILTSVQSSAAFLTTTVLYAKIFILARKHQRCIQQLCITVTSQSGRGGDSSGMTSSVGKQHVSKVSSSEQRRTKMMMMVMGILYVTWIPYMFVKIAVQDNADIIGIAWSSSTLCYEFVSKLLYSNSFMNPMIYHWKSRDFKQSFRKMLHIKPEEEQTAAWVT